MRVLVTGLNGFTGRYVKVELENNGHQAIGLQSDVTDAQAVCEEVEKIKPDAVIHLASVSHIGHANPSVYYNINLIGTVNLLHALSNPTLNIKSVLLVSSANVYGNLIGGTLSEKALTRPENDYSVAKLAMEQMARLHFNRLPIFIVRPFNYTGVGQTELFLIPKIISHFRLKKDTIELGNTKVWREFNDVRAVANKYRRLLESAPVGQTVNVCTGNMYSLNEVIEIAKAITGHDMKIKVNPLFVRENELSELSGDDTLLSSIAGKMDEYLLEDTIAWMLDE